MKWISLVFVAFVFMVQGCQPGKKLPDLPGRLASPNPKMDLHGSCRAPCSPLDSITRAR